MSNRRSYKPRQVASSIDALFRPEILRNVKLDRARYKQRRGIAALEVVIVTAAIIPSLFALLWLGMHTMAAFLSVLGTMLGSPIG